LIGHRLAPYGATGEDAELSDKQFKLFGRFTMAREPRQRKKHHFIRKTILGLLFAVVLFVLYCAWFGMPEADVDTAAGRNGICNILLVGTDESGLRTDTMMLLSINDEDHTARLLSLPRDTYTEGYSVPKLNSACAFAGGGESGMQRLMGEVQTLLRIPPDGYAMVNFDVFENIVDLFGGVKFYVPMDMDYDDPAQDLYIHLQQGYQKLDGEKAIQLMRYRSGYAMADLERVNVQRDFMQAAMDQWLNPWLIVKAPIAGATVYKEMVTDLSPGNCIWLIRALMQCDLTHLETQTLPGTPQYINGGSYFVPDTAAIEELTRELYPYEAIY